MSGRRVMIALAVGFSLAAAPASASADLAANIRVELESVGVPNAQVTIATPAPATAADMATFEASGDEGASMSNDNLISPDPTNPLPLARVAYGSTVATRYPGYLSPVNEGSWPAIEDANGPVWRLAVMSALRHAIADGAVLAGVSMEPSFPNYAGSGPDYWARRPDAEFFPAARLTPILPAGAIETEVRNGLPPINKTAQVAVSDWLGSERILEVSVRVGYLDYPLRDLPGLASYLLDQQLSLNPQGAAIGAIVLRVIDVATANPLSTYAADATSGQQFAWYAPVAQPFESPVSPGAEVVADVEQLATGLAGGAE